VAKRRLRPARALADSELRYRRLFETAKDGILILDAQTGAIDDVNPFLIDMLGYSRAEFLERKLWEVGAFKDVEASKLAFQALQENEYIRYKDLPLRAKSGRLVQVEFVSNVYSVGDQKVIQCNIRDITDRKQAQDALIESEARLREQSVRDHLTGLFNRRYMQETFHRELLRASRNQAPIGVMMLDVNNFKAFNDTWGHAAGDAVLRELGAALLSHVRGEDIVCRYGGDEFTIILPDASMDITRERAESMCEHARRFKIQFEGQELGPIALSIGVSAFPQDGSTTTDLLKAADAALYRAKREGTGCVVTADG
jgi:diguanylate cyclase (GGDEF)-like protein/PAS domain S-box-containing protein